MISSSLAYGRFDFPYTSYTDRDMDGATAVTTIAASGTSFSCPLTTGVVALLLEAHPTYTVDDVLVALRSTSSQTATPDNLLGWGILDAVAALDLVLPTVAPVLSETVVR